MKAQDKVHKRTGARPSIQEQRVLDMEAIQKFSEFLRDHNVSRARTGLSPARALEHLEDPNVQELMSDEDLREIRQAAERLR